jgi:LysR family transcriptional regulator, low CO2-responsive transcriptional regulator
MKEKLNIDPSRVTLKQLRVFDAAIRAGTYSGAAKLLNVTPPAISLQMRVLEDIAGLALTEKTQAGLQPTDAGKILLDTVHRCEAVLAECGAALGALKGVGGGKITVGVVSTAKYFAPRVLAKFAREHPGVELRLLVGNRGETVQAMQDYETDFAVMGRPPNQFEVAQAVIGDHPHVIVAPPDHPMASQEKIVITDLSDETFLLREDGSGTRLLMRRLFAEVGLNPNIGMEIGSNETIKQAVMAGLGIALISAHTVAPESRDGRLVILDVVGLPVMRQWFVVRRGDRELMPASQALWDFLVNSGADFLPQL